MAAVRKSADAPDWRFLDYRCPGVLSNGRPCGKLLGRFAWRTDSMVEISIECRRCGQTHPLWLGARKEPVPEDRP